MTDSKDRLEFLFGYDVELEGGTVQFRSYVTQEGGGLVDIQYLGDVPGELREKIEKVLREEGVTVHRYNASKRN